MGLIGEGLLEDWIRFGKGQVLKDCSSIGLLGRIRLLVFNIKLRLVEGITGQIWGPKRSGGLFGRKDWTLWFKAPWLGREGKGFNNSY